MKASILAAIKGTGKTKQRYLKLANCVISKARGEGNALENGLEIGGNKSNLRIQNGRYEEYV